MSTCARGTHAWLFDPSGESVVPLSTFRAWSLTFVGGSPSRSCAALCHPLATDTAAWTRPPPSLTGCSSREVGDTVACDCPCTDHPRPFPLARLLPLYTPLAAQCGVLRAQPGCYFVLCTLSESHVLAAMFIRMSTPVLYSKQRHVVRTHASDMLQCSFMGMRVIAFSQGTDRVSFDLFCRPTAHTQALLLIPTVSTTKTCYGARWRCIPSWCMLVVLVLHPGLYVPAHAHPSHDDKAPPAQLACVATGFCGAPPPGNGRGAPPGGGRGGALDQARGGQGRLQQYSRTFNIARHSRRRTKRCR